MDSDIATALPDHPFDRDDLLRRLGGRQEVLAELATLFCADADRLQYELKQHMEQRDARAAASTAHQLKGALSNLSATSCANTTRELVVSLRAADWDTADRLAATLRTQLNRLLAVLALEPDA